MIENWSSPNSTNKNELSKIAASIMIQSVEVQITIQNIALLRMLCSQKLTTHAQYTCDQKVWFYILLPNKNKSLKYTVDIRMK